MSTQTSEYTITNCVKEYNKLLFPVKENKGLLLKRSVYVQCTGVEMVVRMVSAEIL